MEMQKLISSQENKHNGEFSDDTNVLKDSTLKTHKHAHSDKQPYSCDSYKFSHNSNSKRCKNMYTGKKPYACEFCKYVCTYKSEIQTHMRIHTGEKPYSCDICGLKYSRKSHLKRHQRIHTGEKTI